MTDDERRRLYGEVWAEPMVVVAKRYGLSDVGMAKLCRRAKIPAPPRGYWARLKAGKMVRRPALTTVGVSATVLVRIPRPRPEHAMQEQPDDPETVAALEREADTAFHIDPGGGPMHRIAGQIQRLYRGGRTDKYGMLQAPRQARQLIRASPTSLLRALHVASLLCRAFEARRWPISLDSSQSRMAQEPTRPLRVSVLGQELRLTIEERSRQSINPSPRQYGEMYEFAPTGQLTLRAQVRGYTAEIIDRANHPSVEMELNEFCRRIIRAAARANARDAEDRRRELDLDTTWQQHEDEENVRQFQAQLVEEIEAEAGNWAKHRQLAEYIAAVREAHAGEPHLMAPDQVLGRWLAWADAHVAQLDPRRLPKLDPENPPALVRRARPPNW